MPKVHEADKVGIQHLSLGLKLRKGGNPKPIPVVTKSVSQPQRIILQVLLGKGQGRAGPRRKFTEPPNFQLTSQPQLILHPYI